MIEVSHADRIVFPEIGATKGEVVAYYERVAPRLLPHVLGRPLSLRRYPKGLSGKGFFQKNVPDHYPGSITRYAVPRSEEASRRHRDEDEKARDTTVYPILREVEHVPYVANQGAIELHVPTARVPEWRADRVVIDLDPPPEGLALVRRAALVVREALEAMGLATIPVATGSKGYHLVASIEPTIAGHALLTAIRQFAALVTERHPDLLTLAFRVKSRGARVFVDWLRNGPMATVVAPYSLRALPSASVALPLAWDEVEHIPPDGFTLRDLEKILDRPDPLADATPSDAHPFVEATGLAFERAGLKLETFDRFRS